MDVGKFISRLRATAEDHAAGALKRGPSSSGDVQYTFGWLCGFQAGMSQAEEVLNQMLNDEAEKEKAA